MGPHDRGHLPDGEEDRLEEVTEKILAALQEGPKTNKYFSSRIALYYGRRIRDLRERGYWIRHERVEKGIFLYTLLDRPDPDWEVDIQLTLPDGRVYSYTVIVQADSRGKARNCAQHKDLIIKVLNARKAPVPPEPPLEPTSAFAPASHSKQPSLFDAINAMRKYGSPKSPP